MEPLKPEDKARILRTRPLAQPADIEEYERLLAERFTKDPSITPTLAPPRGVARSGSGGAVAPMTPDQIREERLSVLFHKLFE